MSANARERLFWPRLDADINQTRMQCRDCNVNAPSQPAEPQIVTPDPELPFEQVCTDFCKIGSFCYLIYADRFSNWVEVAKMKDQRFQTMKKSMLRWFSTFGVPDEMSSDGGPPYNALEYETFLKAWGIEMRKSSTYYPQSNGRTEVAVKTAKHILLHNINDSTGEVYTVAVTRALLAHRNTPNHQDKMSPSELLFGHKMKDHLPNKFRKLRIDWKKARKSREIITSEQIPPSIEKTSRTLKPLSVGDRVAVQNQTGNKPNKWHNMGRVVQILPFRKYMVVMDGSRRITTRNRKFIRKIPAGKKAITDERLIIVSKPSISPLPDRVASPPNGVPRTTISQNEGVPDAMLDETADIAESLPKMRSRKNAGRRFITSTPRKAVVASSPVGIQPAYAVDDRMPKDGWQATIQPPKDPTCEPSVTAPPNVDITPVVTAPPNIDITPVVNAPPGETPHEKYPKRTNVRPPKRYGYQNNN